MDYIKKLSQRKKVRLSPEQKKLKDLDGLYENNENQIYLNASYNYMRLGMTISGDTYPIKETLKQFQFKWDPSDSNWINNNGITAEKFNELLKTLNLKAACR